MPTQEFSRFIVHSSHQLMQASGFVSHYAPTSQGRLHWYRAVGSGKLPPIVIQHGFGTYGAEMFRFLQWVRRFTRLLIVPDLPMHGFSDMPPAGVVIRDLDSMYYEGMEQVLAGVEPVIFFGNSLGGLAAIRYYLTHPERVRVLVLSSPAGARVPQTKFDEVQRIFGELSQQQPAELVDRLYHKPPIYRWFVEQEMRIRFGQDKFQTFMNHFRTEHAFTREELSGIRIPAQVIWGQRDRILEDQLTFFKENMPAHVRFLEPRDYSHAPYLEHPLEMARHINSFALLHCHEVRSTGRRVGA